MIHRPRTLFFALGFTAAQLALSTSASADPGACTTRDGAPSCTILRPLSPPKPPPPLSGSECIVAVGGLGSNNDDGAPDGYGRSADTFAALLAPFRGDPRYVIHRFGSVGEHPELYPYDTYGSIDRNARSLLAFVRALSAQCSAIHVVAHSMGGDVADRAFSYGLSGGDGVLTYQPISTPHNGAFVAWELTRADDMAPGANAALVTFAQGLRDLVGPLGLQIHDVTTPAVRDLAALTPPRPPRDVRELRERLASDEISLYPDTRDRHRDLREWLPAADGRPVEAEGHGGALLSDRIRDTVAAVIRTRSTPPDTASPVDHVLVFIMNMAYLILAGTLFGALGVGLVAGILLGTVVTAVLRALLPSVVQWWTTAFPALVHVARAAADGIAGLLEHVVGVTEHASSFVKGVITRLGTALDLLGAGDDFDDDHRRPHGADPRIALIRSVLDRAARTLAGR